MNLIAIVRWTYLLGWITAAAAVLYRLLLLASDSLPRVLTFEPRTLLDFSLFLFVVSIATAAYAHLVRDVPAKEKAKSASA